MLRSLVGSEMGIRDRVENNWLLADMLAAVHVGHLNIAEAMIEVQGQPVSCLLYTSDAADDLLCVDLGGRRIIKKQTYPVLLRSLSLYSSITLTCILSIVM